MLALDKHLQEQLEVLLWSPVHPGGATGPTSASVQETHPRMMQPVAGYSFLVVTQPTCEVVPAARCKFVGGTPVPVMQARHDRQPVATLFSRAEQRSSGMVGW